MKLKLDENLGRRAVELLAQAGHGVATVASEGLSSAADEGIAVLRLPRKPSHDDLLAAVQTLIGGLGQGNIDGRLWIVQKGRVREYQEEVPE